MKSVLEQAYDEIVILKEKRNNILILTINRPEARNAVNYAVTIQLGDAIEAAERDSDIWVVVLTGAGDKAFCAGGDLKAMSRGEQIMADDPVHEPWGFAGFVNHPISKPIIVAVNGFALGGGTEITCAADLAVASENASFGLAEVRRGIYAGGGGALRLPRQMPKKIGLELLFTGEAISAQRALELGFINKVVPQDQVLEAAIALAEKICQNAPLAVQISKCVALGLRGGRIAAEEDGWAQNDEANAMIAKTRDALEGPKAFAEKRAPIWEAR